VNVPNQVICFTQKHFEVSFSIAATKQMTIGCNHHFDQAWRCPVFAQQAAKDRLGPCTVAVGITHLRIPEGDSIFDDSRSLLNRGTLAYFPCSHSSCFDTNTEPAYLKLQTVGTILLREGDHSSARRKHRVIASLNVPYIEATYEITCRLLDCEWNSFEPLRKAILKLSTKPQQTGTLSVTEVLPSTIRTIERELEKAKEILKKIAPRHLIRTARVQFSVNSQPETQEMGEREQLFTYVVLPN
jgi:hypothetical protein